MESSPCAPRHVSADDEFLSAIDTEFNPRACAFARLVEAVFSLAHDSFEMLRTHSYEKLGRLGLDVINDLYSLVHLCNDSSQCHGELVSDTDTEHGKFKHA